MFRLLVKLFFFIILIAFIVGFFFWGHRAHYLSRYLSGVLGTPTKIEKLHFKGNDLILEGVHIFNSKKSKLEKAFYTDQIRITTQPKKLFAKDIVIEEIKVNAPYIGVELYSADGKENNWSLMINQLTRDGSKETSDKTYLIKSLLLTDVNVHFYNNLTGETIDTKPIPKLELKNLGSKNPMSAKMVLAIIMKEVVKETTKKEGIPGLIQDIKELPQKLKETPAIKKILK